MYVQKQGSGPPVVLIHGLGAYSFSWRGTVKALEGSQTIYAVDLLGFGQSPVPSGFPNTMKAQADAVVDFMRAEKLVNPVIIGHSMGGGVALGVAARAGKSGTPGISKLIVLDPVAYSPTSPLLGLDPGRLSGMASLPMSPALSRELVQQILERAYRDREKVTDSQINGYAKGLSTLGQFQALLSHASKLGDLAVPEAQLAKIAVKTLIIWGDHDPFLDPSNGGRLQRALPDAKLVSIKDCGHIPHEEWPEETNGAIRAFL